MAEQVMDVRSSAVFLRQRWRALGAAGVVGAILGVLYMALVPGQLGSTALVLLPEASTSPGAGQTETQVHIVLSAPVLEKAGKSVTPALSVAEVDEQIHVSARTSRLIEIQAMSRRAPQAQALSQAVAEAYIATLQDNARRAAAGPLRDLTARETALTGQLQSLQTEIDATSERARGEDAEGRDAQLLAQLTAEQADISLQLDKLKDDISAFEMSDEASAIQIIQPAAPATGPSQVRRLITGALIGGVSAVAAAALVLLIRRLRNPRVHARDDLADAVGSSVLAGVASRPQRSVAQWLTFFETYEASAVEAWAFRQVLRALVASPASNDPSRTGNTSLPGWVEHPRSLTLIAFAGDPRGVAVGPLLAVCAASLGIATRLVVATGHDSAPALCAACATDRGSQLRTGLILEAGTDDALTQNASSSAIGNTFAAPGYHSVDLTIVLAVVDRQEATLRGVPGTSVTVLGISPGVATREELARLAVAVDDGGRRIDGIVVADPDPSDRTTGRRTLDERALQTPLPIRMTGSGQVSMPAGGHRRAR
jgi:capsular polysaccharide biosynthesis protein